MKPVRGEVLPPERSGAMQGGGSRPMASSFVARVRNEVVQRELSSYLANVRSWNDIVAALNDGERLRQDYTLMLQRSSQLPELRMAEAAKVLDEIRTVFDDIADREKERELRSARLDAELIKARRALDALAKTERQDSNDGRGARRSRRIREILADRDAMIAAFVGERTEGDLSEEERRIISDIRLAAEHEIKRFLEEDRD